MKNKDIELKEIKKEFRYIIECNDIGFMIDFCSELINKIKSKNKLIEKLKED